MTREVVIRAEQLTKRYGATLAVDHVDLEVHSGQIVGILGPNGSGKTTTILMLLGLTEPTEGRAEVAGFDPLREPLEVKRRVGYLPDSVGFYDGLSAHDNLAYTGRLAGLSRREIDERFAEALAKAGIERSPLTSAAMSLSATSVTHGAPKAIAMINSAAAATTHDLRVSTDENVDCSINFASRTARRFFPDENLSQGDLHRDAK